MFTASNIVDAVLRVSTYSYKTSQLMPKCCLNTCTTEEQ